MCSLEDKMKIIARKKKYIILLLILLVLGSFIYIKINFQDLKGRYIIYTQKNKLNNVVTFLKENYSSNLKSISFSCNKSVCKKFNERVGFVDEIADDENAISSLNSLNKKYCDDNKYFYSADAYYDKNGKAAVLFNYYEKAVHLDYKFNIKYIVYVDKDFNMEYFPTHKNLNKINGNWYTLSIITVG